MPARAGASKAAAAAGHPAAFETTASPSPSPAAAAAASTPALGHELSGFGPRPQRRPPGARAEGTGAVDLEGRLVSVPAPGSPFVLRPGEGRVVIVDVETQRSAEEVGGWSRIRDMGLALAVVLDVATHQYTTYLERDVERLVLELVMADLVVGYNTERFDFAVLSGYGDWNFERIRSFDMLRHIKTRLGFRLKLGDLAAANLGAGKSADGLQSLAWFKEGRLDLIEEYCRRDVEVTARLFFLGRERGYLLYQDHAGRSVRLPVTW